MAQDFNSNELQLLHKIQSLYMRNYRVIQSKIAKETDQRQTRIYQQKLSTLNLYIQMTILAISEALGFGG